MTDTNDIAGLVGAGMTGIIGLGIVGVTANLANNLVEAGTQKPKKKNHNIENDEWLDFLF
jgi:hypothetical protein